MYSRLTRSIILIVIFAVIAGFLAIAVNIYPDLLWFGEVGYTAVYKTILLTKIMVGILVGGVVLVVTLINLYLIFRFTPSRLSPTLIQAIPIEGQLDFDLRKGLYGVLALIAIAFSGLMGYSATDKWEIFLRYTKGSNLNFQSATALAAPANRGATEVILPQIALDAKGLRGGDNVVIEEGNQRQTATVQSIAGAGDGSARVGLNQAIDFDATKKAALVAAARDPIFHKNVGYYVFKMPLERLICGSLFGLFMLMTLFTGVIYFFQGSLISERNRLEPSQRVKTHLLVLIGLTLLFRAWNYQFAMYDLLYTTSDVVRGGGGYASMQARLPVLKILMVLVVLCALVFFISIFLRRLIFAVGSIVVFLLVGFIGQVYPVFVQKWRVEPRKQDLEARYINYNIKATLHAYDLEDNTVGEQEYPLAGELSYEGIASQENVPIIHNIRLWDWRPLRRIFRQLQELRSQYDFPDVDIDRYPMDGTIQQVMLSARELNINDLPPEVRNDWFKRTYVYTHGYGAVMSPVNEVIDGRPKMYIRDIDPINYEPEWKDRFNDDPGPRIYYGERTQHYVIVHPNRRTKLEFDYPEAFGQQYQTYAYHGAGGVELSSFWRRFIYMLKFDNQINFVLPGEITSTSRVLYHRDIKERVNKIAPFLRYDGDPYLVIHNGRLIWIIDAYTTTERYPYSAPMQDVLRAKIAEQSGRRAAARIIGGEQPWGNYIRNSVKVTLDVYDGSVNFYLMEQEKDPIAECYRRIFPDLFKSFATMPEELKTHIRYPETMFLIQARVYQDYHMKDPITFYASEDQWEIGEELYDNTERPRPQPAPIPTSPFVPRPQQSLPSTVTNVQDVAPYYVVLKLPGEERAEFMLMLPFTPKNKPNLTAWLAARCDQPQYGQLLVYRFPKGKLAPGPMQVENFISQEPEISQQISLWNTQGSRVLRGNLLIIPMNNSILYVEPIYIQSENEESSIPELRRVVVGYKENVVWAESFDDALTQMFGRMQAMGPVQQPGLPSSPGITEASTRVPTRGLSQTQISELVKQAKQQFERAQAAQRAGDWAEYGRALNLLEKTLKQLETNVQ